METARRFGDMIDRRIGQSTFGRIFRLEGSGHVSFTSACTIQRYQDVDKILQGQGDQEFQIPYGDPCWSHDILHDGIHHRRKCK